MGGARRKTAKRTKPTKDGADVRAFTVVVEEIHSKINVFGEKLQAVDASLGELRAETRAGFRRVDQRLDEVDRDMLLVKSELAVVKTDITLVKTDSFGHVKTDVGLVKEATLDINREIKGLRRAVEDIEARKVDRDELTSAH